MKNSIDYKNLPNRHSIQNVPELQKLFWDQIAWDWIDQYKQRFTTHGEVTLQHFYNFSFIIDHIWPDHESPESLETRVVGAFGISGADDVNANNRKIVRSYWGSMTKAYGHLGCKFDKGHFIAHGFGGPIDVNLFPQRRDVNRGWCAEGKRYRAMERFVAANAGTFVFSHPLYQDLSCCPYEVEYGYCDSEMNITVETFPNR